MSIKQEKQREWKEQWQMLQDNELFLFKDWIYPAVIDDFTEKDVLECGCGGGQHTSFIAPYARKITAVDLNSVKTAKETNKNFKNITFIADDIAQMDLKKTFDIVFSIGVIHHTDNPEKTVKNLIMHTKAGGKLIIWVYSKEGNFLVEYFLEPVRKIFLTKIGRKPLLYISKFITAFMYIPIYTIYFLPFRFLPFYEYFQNFRRMSFYRNLLNVFDKINAPQVQFISRARAEKWLTEEEFSEVLISSYNGVSWRISGIKK